MRKRVGMFWLPCIRRNLPMAGPVVFPPDSGKPYTCARRQEEEAAYGRRIRLDEVCLINMEKGKENVSDYFDHTKEF